MLLLKACPHCHGDLVFEQDGAYGYFTCVQCGHVLSAAQERALGYRVTALGALHASAGLQPAQRPRRTTRSNARRPTRTSGAARHARLRLVKTPAV
jgi:hypothetical protein